MTGTEVSDLREWVRGLRAGVLSTRLDGEGGLPFGSLVPFVVLGNACVGLYLSPLAQHSKNLNAFAGASLTLWDEPASPSSGSRRICLVGRAEVATSGVDAPFKAKYPETAAWKGLGFVHWSLRVERAHVVRGFGSAGWIEPADIL
ncbi:MAG: hypothetical protein MOGMAGMI_01260 [Candidatus Omnitrophica bacterium]|nr:hypothetical protein [Candidatus Omnitrophota bacterium]